MRPHRHRHFEALVTVALLLTQYLSGVALADVDRAAAGTQSEPKTVQLLRQAANREASELLAQFAFGLPAAELEGVEVYESDWVRQHGMSNTDLYPHVRESSVQSISLTVSDDDDDAFECQIYRQIYDAAMCRDASTLWDKVRGIRNEQCDRPPMRERSRTYQTSPNLNYRIATVRVGCRFEPNAKMSWSEMSIVGGKAIEKSLDR